MSSAADAADELRDFAGRLARAVDAERNRSLHLPATCLLASLVAKACGVKRETFLKLCGSAYDLKNERPQ